MSKKFPEKIFVTRDSNCSDENNLLAWLDEGDGIEDRGPTVVATYELVATQKLGLEVKKKP
jgi:hypothetical protein